MSADVARMYRQVELNDKHRDYHRHLSRLCSKENVQTYRMTKVTYGVACSSYHAVRSFLKLSKIDEILGETSRAIERDFYTDGVLTGATSEQEAELFQAILVRTLKARQFDLKKRTSSEPCFTLKKPPEYREGKEDLDFHQNTRTIKTLGIVRNPNYDVSHFKVMQLNETIFATNSH